MNSKHDQWAKDSVSTLFNIISGGGDEPPPPVDSSKKQPDDDGMQARIEKLEAEIPLIRERLAKIETRLDHTATKDDVSRLESTLLKWFIGTALTLTGLAFAAAKFIH